MITRTSHILTILSALLGAGCATSHSDDGLVRDALREREAAYVRVAKAITHYCSVSTDTVDARQACILERRLSLVSVDHSSRR